MCASHGIPLRIACLLNTTFNRQRLLQVLGRACQGSLAEGHDQHRTHALPGTWQSKTRLAEMNLYT